MFSDHFDVLMSKIIFLKNIILMCFEMKSTLKSNQCHTLKHKSSIHTQKNKKIKKSRLYPVFFCEKITLRLIIYILL